MTKEETELIIKEQDKSTKEILKMIEQQKCELLGIIQGKDKVIKELEEKISVLLSCKNCPENKVGLLCVKEYENKCLAQKIEFIKELQEENAELKEQISNVRECFISASSGDDFEMAENAREVMEVLDIPCYRHKDKRKKSKLTKAKEILAKLLEEEKNNMYWEMNGSDKSSYYEVRKQAEQFLKDCKVEK